MEKQFAFIRQNWLSGHTKPRLSTMMMGYPRRVYIDPKQNVADEYYGFEVQGFTTLVR